MAKKVKGATITFEVTDNGTLKMVGQNSRTAKKGLDNVGKSAGDVRRNMQAMSGRVESGTKGFARMQQGTGGLVQSYAILASTLFALGAAFRAMENAANIENQTKGFRALAQITGTSLLSITESVRSATGSMLDFQTAAQQTAIASAAGFTADQIRFLAEGAKLASVTLGRDLTDSFNRLIRGVTKAEPELLDELGIILRLDIATRKFAAANGLVAEKLTIAERRMAVFEEVQRQLIGNFGAMRDEADNFLNPFSRLSVAISDLIKAMQGPVVEFFASFAEFLTQNIGALTTAFALLGLSILRQIVPSIGTLSASFTEMGNNAVRAANKADSRMKASARLVRMRSKTEVAAEINKSQIVRKEIIRRFGSEEAFNKKSMAGQLARIKFMIQMEKMGMSKTRQFNQQRLSSLMVVEKRIQEEIKRTGLISNAVLGRMKVQLHSIATGPINALKIQFGKLAGVITTLGKAVSFLGAAFSRLLMAAMAFFTLKFMVDMLPSIKKINNIVQELSGNLKSTNTELKEMAFFADRTLLEDKLESINREFGTIEGTLKGANVELEFFNNMIKGIAGPSSDNFKEFIQEESRKIIELFSEGGTTGFGSQFQGFLARTGMTSGPGSPPAGLTNRSFADRSATTLGTTSSQALQDATTIQLNSIITNAIAQINAGQITAAADILSILGEETGQKFINGFQEAVEEEGKHGQAAVAFTSAFKTSLMDQNADALAMTFFKGLDEGFTVTGFSEALVETIRLMTEFREGITEITGVTVEFEEEAKSLSESLVGMIPKPSNAEKTAAQLESMLRTVYELDEAGNRTTNLKDMTMTMEDGTKIRGSLKQIAKEQLGIEAETDEILLSILESERERLELVDKRLQTHKTLATLVKMEIDRLAFVNTRVSKRMQTEFKIFDLQLKQVAALDKFGLTQTDLVKLQGAAAENLSDAEKEILAGNKALEQQIDLLESSLDRIEMLGKALLETFDSSAATNLAKLFDTANLGEFGGKEFINALAVDLRKTVSKSMAEGLVDGATEMLTPEKFKMNKKLDPAQKILQVHKQHVDGLAGILDMHVQGIAQVMGHQGTVPSVTANFDPSDPNAATYGSLFGPSGDTKPGGFRDALQGHFGKGGTLLTGLFGRRGAQTRYDSETEDGIEELTVSKVPDKAGILGTYGGTDIFGIKKAMDSTFGEGGSFEESGGKIFGEGGMFQSIGSSLFDTFFGSGGMGSSLLSIFGFAKGGYTAIQAASGGTFSGPTTGYPATLHGNEAVVPLPDGKNIPVDLGAKANNTNNTNITVNMADGSSTTDSDGAAQLAQAIDAAVQNTIEKELRPGGILAG